MSTTKDSELLIARCLLNGPAAGLTQKMIAGETRCSVPTVSRALTTFRQQALASERRGRWYAHCDMLSAWVDECETLLGAAIVTSISSDLVAGGLPPGIRDRIRRQLSAVEDKLSHDRMLVGNRLLLVPRGPEMWPQNGAGSDWQVPSVDDGAYETLCRALRERVIKKVAIRYRRHAGPDSREVTETISPQGLLIRSRIPYLVFLRDENDGAGQPVSVPIHRISSADKVNEDAICPPMTLTRYAKGAFAGGSGDLITLRFRITRRAGSYLFERGFRHQQIEPSKCGEWYEVVASDVPDTDELLWWLLSFGAKLKVLGPDHLAQRVADTIADAHKLYGEEK